MPADLAAHVGQHLAKSDQVAPFHERQDLVNRVRREEAP